MEDMPQLALAKHQLPHFCQSSRGKSQYQICRQRMYLIRQEIARLLLVKTEIWPRPLEGGPIMHRNSLPILSMKWEGLLLQSVWMTLISWSLTRRFNLKPIFVKRKLLFLRTVNKNSTQCVQASTNRMKIRNQISRKSKRSMLMLLKKWKLGLEDLKLVDQLVGSANSGAKQALDLIATDLRILIKPTTHSLRCSTLFQRSLKN